MTPAAGGLGSRPLPALTPEVEAFWTGGADGELRLPACPGCAALLHPSEAVCRRCLRSDLGQVAVSGRGTVVAATVNHHRSVPGLAPPYAVAVVALDDDPRVRLTTNVVGCEPDEVVIGMPVRVVFEHHGDVSLPLFTPAGDTPSGDGSDGSSAPGLLPPVAAPATPLRPAVPRARFEERVALTGTGVSAVGRHLMRPPVALAVEACRAAVADAGLQLSDIDGLVTYPGGGKGGMSEGGVPAVEAALGIHPVWHNGGSEAPGQIGSIIAAMLAVAAGLCRHVLCFRTVWESSYAQLARAGKVGGVAARVEGDAQWRLPFGAGAAANPVALAASAYLHHVGCTREVLGRIAVNARANAARNPLALYREPITLDDYFDARMISSPLGLLDCDALTDGAVAVVVSAVDAARDLPRPVRVEAVGTRVTERPSWDQGTLTHLPMVFGPAAHLWTRTSLSPADVDVAELYDGFTFNCLSWIEALGFCGVGECPDYLDGGRRIALDGDLPLNTHGGQLSGGRLHGYGFVREAMLQLRGAATGRQVPGAAVAAVATGGGGGHPGGCLLLTQW